MIDKENCCSRRSSAKTDRNARIITLRRAGRTYEEIAREFSLSRGRVRQIIVHYERGLRLLAAKS
jgi:DNA-directed RNA polymerase sigma subunit (sigma70/sigma32)